MGYTRAEIPMESVHGIAVSGGSFPAEMWRRFMEPALLSAEPTPFAEPTVWPEWKDFTRGEYALTYDPNYVAPAEPEAEEEAPATRPPRPSPGRIP